MVLPSFIISRQSHVQQHDNLANDTLSLRLASRRSSFVISRHYLLLNNAGDDLAIEYLCRRSCQSQTIIYCFMPVSDVRQPPQGFGRDRLVWSTMPHGQILLNYAGLSSNARLIILATVRQHRNTYCVGNIPKNGARLAILTYLPDLFVRQRWLSTFFHLPFANNLLCIILAAR